MRQSQEDAPPGTKECTQFTTTGVSEYQILKQPSHYNTFFLIQIAWIKNYTGQHRNSISNGLLITDIWHIRVDCQNQFKFSHFTLILYTNIQRLKKLAQNKDYLILSMTHFFIQKITYPAIWYVGMVGKQFSVLFLWVTLCSA